FVTERAVFQLSDKGPVLIEIAKGINLQNDILNQMEFVPVISDNLAIMPTELYEENSFGLKKIINENKHI
ncbi:MAG: acyl CoA:acetate/3-ketoacid CoA transferase, partial [Oscillospiraceae bacterium]